MKRFFKMLLEIIFPTHCYLCKNIVELEDYSICSDCILDINIVENYCHKCGSVTENMQKFCGHCVNKEIYYDRLFSVCGYDKTIAGFLKLIKFRSKESNLERLELLYNLFCSENPAFLELDALREEIDFILPVPIHKNRRDLRGYNQSELIAHVVSNQLEISVESEILLKQKDTQFFFGLNPKERELELVNAFVIMDKEKILGKNILIVDDISTTGTTFNTISKILVENGANMVFGFCVAKA